MTDEAQREAFEAWARAWSAEWSDGELTGGAIDLTREEPSHAFGYACGDTRKLYASWLASAARFDAVVGAAEALDEGNPRLSTHEQTLGDVTKIRWNKKVLDLRVALAALAPNREV